MLFVKKQYPKYYNIGANIWKDVSAWFEFKPSRVASARDRFMHAVKCMHGEFSVKITCLASGLDSVEDNA